MTIEECHELCKQNSACTYWVYGGSGKYLNYCLLRNGINMPPRSTSSDVGLIAGPKRCLPSKC